MIHWSQSKAQLASSDSKCAWKNKDKGRKEAPGNQ